MIRKLLLLIIFIIFPVLTFGQSIWTNPITGSNPGQTNPYTTGETRNANISVSGIGRTGVSGSNGNNVYNTTNWNIGLTSNKYIEFILTPNNGYKIDFISLQHFQSF